jgi:hypothetical protein
MLTDDDDDGLSRDQQRRFAAIQVGVAILVGGPLSVLLPRLSGESLDPWLGGAGLGVGIGLGAAVAVKDLARRT